MSNSRVVLITGANSGIGADTARLLLDRGDRVAVTGRNEDKLKRFVEDSGHADRLLAIHADAGDWEATRNAVEKTVARFGRLDAAVANAGFASADYHRTDTNVFDDGDPTQWAPMVLTNILGPAYLAKAALPHLAAVHGRLVLIGSVAGLKNVQGNLYSVTKWAVTALAENLRMYATTIGVGTTLIAPGMTDTDFFQEGAAPPYAMPADVVATTIVFALDQPHGVDLNTLTVRPIGQTA